MTVGSQTNVDEEGLDAKDPRRAAILQMNLDGSNERVFASGLRNPNGMDFFPNSSALWTVVNERDKTGEDLVPDFLTTVQKKRILWMAVFVFRAARRSSAQREAAGIGGEGDRSGRPSGRTYGIAGNDLLSRHDVPGALSQRSLHRPARVVEPVEV